MSDKRVECQDCKKALQKRRYIVGFVRSALYVICLLSLMSGIFAIIKPEAMFGKLSNIALAVQNLLSVAAIGISGYVILVMLRDDIIGYYEYVFHDATGGQHVHLNCPQDNIEWVAVVKACGWFRRGYLLHNGEHWPADLTFSLTYYINVFEHDPPIYKFKARGKIGSGRFSLETHDLFLIIHASSLMTDQWSEPITALAGRHLALSEYQKSLQQEREVFRTESHLLQQAILIVLDAIYTYRRSFGNSKYGKFIDSFLRRVMLKVFGKPVSIGPILSEKINDPELKDLARRSLAELGIRTEAYL